MLELTIPASESWDERKEEFVVTRKEQTLKLEHSLVSLSKWESKWCKPFISTKERTPEETMDYIKCMTVSPNVDPIVYNLLTNEHIKQVNEYISAPMTATTISGTNGGKQSRDVVTAELIYYWMIALNIPFECQKWHLNRLLMLIRVCNHMNQPPKKMSKRDVMSRNAALNAARRKQLNTNG